jgi:RNA polymerase primary sigma factor
MKNDTTPNSLQRYLHDMSQYDVLTQEEETQCAQNMVDAYNSLVHEMLRLPSVWSRIRNQWDYIKLQGKATNKMAEEYGNQRFPSEELTLQVDTHIEAAILFEKNSPDKAAYMLKAAGLSKQIYLGMVNEILAQPISGESRDLIQIHRQDLTRYQHQLITSNLRLVIKFAKGFGNCGVPMADLIQEGNLGLMRAVEKFDPGRGRFSTYAAWWIRQSFLKALKRQSKTIRLPSHIHDVISKLKKTHEGLCYELSHEPSITEVAAIADISPKLIEKLMNLRGEPLSLEMTFPALNYRNDTRPKCLKDFIEDDALSPLDTIDLTRRDRLVKDAVKSLLSKSERQVISLRFGLGGQEPKTLEEIAALIDLSRERIRQLEASAIDKLKTHARYLEEYNNE